MRKPTKIEIVSNIIIMLMITTVSVVFLLADSFKNQKYKNIEIYKNEQLITASFNSNEFGYNSINQKFSYKKTVMYNYDYYIYREKSYNIISVCELDDSFIFPSYTDNCWYKAKLLYGSGKLEDGIIIDEVTSINIFGKINSVGEKIILNNESNNIDFTVTGVISSNSNHDNNIIFINDRNKPGMNPINPNYDLSNKSFYYWFLVSNVKQIENLTNYLRVLNDVNTEDFSIKNYFLLKKEVDASFGESIKTFLALSIMLIFISVVVEVLCVYIIYNNKKKEYSIEMALGASFLDITKEIVYTSYFYTFLSIFISTLISNIGLYIYCLNDDNYLYKLSFITISITFLLPALISFIANIFSGFILGKKNLIEMLKND